MRTWITTASPPSRARCSAPRLRRSGSATRCSTRTSPSSTPSASSSTPQTTRRCCYRIVLPRSSRRPTVITGSRCATARTAAVVIAGTGCTLASSRGQAQSSPPVGRRAPKPRFASSARRANCPAKPSRPRPSRMRTSASWPRPEASPRRRRTPSVSPASRMSSRLSRTKTETTSPSPGRCCRLRSTASSTRTATWIGLCSTEKKGSASTCACTPARSARRWTACLTCTAPTAKTSRATTTAAVVPTAVSP